VSAVTCPDCGRTVATSQWVYIAAGESPDPEHSGQRVELEPGYVNVGRRHASGSAWYRRGSDPERPSPSVRAPLVVTCRCGRDVAIAASDVKFVPHRATDEEIDAAGDAWAADRD